MQRQSVRMKDGRLIELCDSRSIVPSILGNIRSRPKSNGPTHGDLHLSSSRSNKSTHDQSQEDFTKHSETTEDSEANGENILLNPITHSNENHTITGNTNLQGGSSAPTPREEILSTPLTTERQNVRIGSKTPMTRGSRASPKSSQSNASANYLTQPIDKLTTIIIKREYKVNVGQLCTTFTEVHGSDTIQCKL